MAHSISHSYLRKLITHFLRPIAPYNIEFVCISIDIGRPVVRSSLKLPGAALLHTQSTVSNILRAAAPTLKSSSANMIAGFASPTPSTTPPLQPTRSAQPRVAWCPPRSSSITAAHTLRRCPLSCCCFCRACVCVFVHSGGCVSALLGRRQSEQQNARQASVVVVRMIWRMGNGWAKCQSIGMNEQRLRRVSLSVEWWDVCVFKVGEPVFGCVLTLIRNRWCREHVSAWLAHDDRFPSSVGSMILHQKSSHRGA